MNNNSDAILHVLLSYAECDENIRAVLMEGSRALGNVDKYSDYDIVFVTESSELYFDGAIMPFLIEKFGEIVVMQTPDNGDPHDVYTHLIQFANGVRIDLTFNSIAFLNHTALESATVVLMDKDNRFFNISPSSDADFWLKPPSAPEYLSHCNQFWWCSPYVAKAIIRRQTLHALELLSDCVRREYAWMLLCLAGVRNNWAKVNPGKHNTNILGLLSEDDMHYYNTLLNSYVHSNNNEISLTLDNIMAEYNKLAPMVAELLNFSYNFMEAEKTMQFIKNLHHNETRIKS